MTKIQRKLFIVLMIAYAGFNFVSRAQINTDQVMIIGRNALYFEDYVLSIQYFNQVIKVKPYLAEPYFFRAVAKFYLEDYRGAESDCSLAIERNPFIIDAYQVRGIARQTLKNNEGAIEDYDSGLKYLPENKIFLLNKAVAQQEIKDFDGADATLNRLMDIYPKFDNGYLCRAQLYLEKGDTAVAMDNLAKCLDLNSNNTNAYLMRADVRIKSRSDYKGALEDMDQAIKLEPKHADYFVNRAFLKYHLDDYFGAMSDFDYAIGLEPSNVAAHFNRGLLRMEVQDNNKAIEDFSFVLQREPDNDMARYNRAVLYQKTRQYGASIKDFDVVIEKYPNLSMVYYDRSESKRLSGDLKGGEKDFNRSKELSRKKAEREYDVAADSQNTEADESPEAIMKKFKSLVTVENDNSVKPEYENKYRGKVQNYAVSIDIEPVYVLSYYDRATELRADAYYQKELDDINSGHYLRDKLYMTNASVKLSEEEIQLQFDLVRYYSNLISGQEKRAVDYFGRAISYMMVKNYTAAIEDLSMAVELSPRFTLAYFARAMARYCSTEVSHAGQVENSMLSYYGDKKVGKDAMGEAMAVNDRFQMESVFSDLNKVLELSPRLVYAHFNRGNIYLSRNDYTAAISCYTEAIAIKPDFGEAYYNRGMAYLQLGNKDKGIADLSKAGELGILSSYNVLKRMSR